MRAKRGQNDGHGGGVARRDLIDQDLNQPAADAVLIDTSEHSVAEIVEQVLALIRQRQQPEAGAAV